MAWSNVTILRANLDMAECADYARARAIRRKRKREMRELGKENRGPKRNRAAAQ